MNIIRVPFRVSFFGGSTDYKSFFSEYGSFIIGSSINKHHYIATRIRPQILSDKFVIVSSVRQDVSDVNQISNKLIRETLKFKRLNDKIELFSFSDIPSQTGLGGSSSYCVGLILSINKLLNIRCNKKILAKEAIFVEREVLKESGGIQDQIWASYGGFNSIEINKNGNFFVKPIPVTEDFKKIFFNSLLLIYTNERRIKSGIPQSHENKNKLNILQIAKQAYGAFLKEDIKTIGELLYESWMEKVRISELISTPKINDAIEYIMNNGAYGAKLLGSGGCGFILAICSPLVKKNIKQKFFNQTLDIYCDERGACQIY